MKPITPLLDRMIAKIDADGPCWEWTGALTDGYGVVGRGRRHEGIVQTHRAMWQLLVGEIPHGLDLDHLCRNRKCCNPDHLEPVTRKENVARGARRPGYRKHVEYCKQGHRWSPENTKQTTKQRICITCSREQARQQRLRAKNR